MSPKALASERIWEKEKVLSVASSTGSCQASGALLSRSSSETSVARPAHALLEDLLNGRRLSRFPGAVPARPAVGSFRSEDSASGRVAPRSIELGGHGRCLCSRAREARTGLFENRFGWSSLPVASSFSLGRQLRHRFRLWAARRVAEICGSDLVGRASAARGLLELVSSSATEVVSQRRARLASRLQNPAVACGRAVRARMNSSTVRRNRTLTDEGSNP